MCGICGIVHANPDEPVDPEALLAMRELLRHRGPDGAGVWRARGVGLAHRRLTIIDLTDAGRQPLSNEDGSVWITYNGEVYNFRELRDELMARGHVFRSRTDTEVLVHLYEECGERLVERLRGMFAFGLWDERRRQLLLARDRLGVKPLYYALSPPGDLVFGSEIKAVLASGLPSAQLDWQAFSEYLATRYTTGARSLFADVRRLPPGHIAVWRDGRLRVTPYWRFPTAGVAPDPRSERELVEEFYERFAESVRLRMISDAPIGLFLSGGIDSASIAAVMAREAGAPIRTFSVAFHEPEADEAADARTMAHGVGARHREVFVRPEEFFAELPRLIWHEDEPIAFPSSVPLYFVSRLAAEDVKVVLTGEGSDELLAGYGKYWRAILNLGAARWYGRLPAFVRTRVREVIARLPDGRWASRLARSFLYQPDSIEALYLDAFSVFGRERQEMLLSPELQARLRDAGVGLDPYEGHRAILGDLDGVPILERLLALDALTYLQELLMKQDQMSMAASIESRVPFLDHHLVQFIASLPRSLKLRRRVTKQVLRLAMRRHLPPGVLTRRKMGFPTPVGEWLRGSHAHLLDDVLLSSRARQRGLFQPRAVAELVRQHRAGLLDHTERLWALLNVELWFRTCVDSPRTVAAVA